MSSLKAFTSAKIKREQMRGHVEGEFGGVGEGIDGYSGMVGVRRGEGH